MKPVVSRVLRLGLTALFVVMLVLFARKVNWHDTWRTMQTASMPVLWPTIPRASVKRSSAPTSTWCTSSTTRPASSSVTPAASASGASTQ